MTAYKCDRCGKLFERKCKPDVTVTRYVHGYGEIQPDFCLECYLELLKFCNFENHEELYKSAVFCYK